MPRSAATARSPSVDTSTTSAPSISLSTLPLPLGQVERTLSVEGFESESPPASPRQAVDHLTDSDDNDFETSDSPASPPTEPLGLLERSMSKSKAPLLLRSSPGFGTGSYGAVPIGVTAETSDEEDFDRSRSRRQVRSKTSRLRNVASTGSFRIPSTVRRGSVEPSSLNPQRRKSMNSGRSTALPSYDTGLEVEGDLGNDVGFESNVHIGGIPIRNDKSFEASRSQDHLLGGEDPDEDAVAEDATPSEDEDPPDNSPYSQVRASVSAVDNTTLSINTPRMWILSMLFAVLGSSTNLFFSLRYPSVSITPVIALLLVHPLGLIWDQLLKRPDDPEEQFIDGVLVERIPHIDTTDESLNQITTKDGFGRRLRLWLAQGKWNEKEHSCVYISSNVSFGFAFATDVIVEQTKFYNQEVSIMYQLLLILSTQILGYSFAGLARRFLVRPGGMIWPGTLMSAAMFTTLHKEKNVVANGWKVSRWKFFFIIWLGSFIFYFLPGLLMPALSYFNVITWFAPKNVVIANLFGVASGLGLFPLTFDWAQIA